YGEVEPAAAEVCALSLHDALPISPATTLAWARSGNGRVIVVGAKKVTEPLPTPIAPMEAPRSWNAPAGVAVSMALGPVPITTLSDRKSTRLNSSHVKISYAVFCLK